MAVVFVLTPRSYQKKKEEGRSNVCSDLNDTYVLWIHTAFPAHIVHRVYRVVLGFPCYRARSYAARLVGPLKGKELLLI